MFKPHEIEEESMRIILRELGEHAFDSGQLRVVLRVIHATADFEFAGNLRFSEYAVETGVNLLKAGCCIVSDVHMVEAGIDKKRLGRLGGYTRCLVDQPQVEQSSRETGMTRAAAGVNALAHEMDGAVVVVGNAPTALRQVLLLAQQKKAIPALVVGVPVGFVNACESKDELWQSGLTAITSLGRKGGSTVAAAIINALLRLAVEDGSG